MIDKNDPQKFNDFNFWIFQSVIFTYQKQTKREKEREKSYFKTFKNLTEYSPPSDARHQKDCTQLPYVKGNKHSSCYLCFPNLWYFKGYILQESELPKRSTLQISCHAFPAIFRKLCALPNEHNLLVLQCITLCFCIESLT